MKSNLLETLWKILILACGLLSACQTIRTSQPTAIPTFDGVIKAGIFRVKGIDGDPQVAKDVADTLQRYAPEICKTLGVNYQKTVSVELFIDQEDLDQNGTNPKMRGYYAYSGYQHIQMVSPRNPLPHLDSDYSSRILIAVHEFAHLVNNEIDPHMPVWLNEGLAIYVAPHELYTYVTRYHFPFHMIPSLEALEHSYDSLAAADLFAFSLVEFLAVTYGQETLNRWVSGHLALEDALGVPRGQIERDWRAFMEQNYQNQPR